MSYDKGGLLKRISNSSRSMVKVPVMVATTGTSFSDAESGISKILTVSAGNKRLSFCMIVSKNRPMLHLSASFYRMISPKSSRRCRKNAPACSSPTVESPKENELDRDRITNLFQSAIRAGNSTCSLGDASRFAHRFVTAHKTTTGNVLIYSPDGCISVMLDHSGNVLYSQPSIREIGIDPSLLKLRMTRSKQAKQTEA